MRGWQVEGRRGCWIVRGVWLWGWGRAEGQTLVNANTPSKQFTTQTPLAPDPPTHPSTPQYFSIVVWVAGDSYWTYAICIFVITWFSIITSAVEAHSNMKRLADIAYFATEVRGRRLGGGRLAAWGGWACFGGVVSPFYSDTHTPT